MILKWNLDAVGGFAWTSDTGQAPVQGSNEHEDDSSGSVKCWEIVEQLSDRQLLEKDSALYSWMDGQVIASGPSLLKSSVQGD
jgi:hypothetical protein